MTKPLPPHVKAANKAARQLAKIADTLRKLHQFCACELLSGAIRHHSVDTYGNVVVAIRRQEIDALRGEALDHYRAIMRGISRTPNGFYKNTIQPLGLKRVSSDTIDGADYTLYCVGPHVPTSCPMCAANAEANAPPATLQGPVRGMTDVDVSAISSLLSAKAGHPWRRSPERRRTRQ